MKRWLAWIVCLSLVVAVYGCALPCSAAVPVAGERVIDLPQDQGQWYVTVFGSEADARYREIVRWFDSHPVLRRLREQTKWHAVAIQSKVFRERYQDSVPVLPSVRVQSADGRIVYQLSGDQIPATADELADLGAEALRRRLLDICPDGVCPIDDQPPRLDPAPVPVVQPTPPAIVRPPVIVSPAPPAPRPSGPNGYVVLGLVLGFGVPSGLAGAYAAWRKSGR